MNPTIDLAISSKHMSCQSIMNLLQTSCKIKPTFTKICKNNICYTEHGCDITFTEPIDLLNTWNILKQHNDIQCAYLNIHGQYKGCILNYLRDSSCPKT